MCRLFDEWSPQIKAYYEKNDLSFEKAKGMSQCWGRDDLVLQYYDENRSSGRGLLDESPMPVVLKITKVADGLRFEKTEYTQKYLA